MSTSAPPTVSPRLSAMRRMKQFKRPRPVASARAEGPQQHGHRVSKRARTGARRVRLNSVGTCTPPMVLSSAAPPQSTNTSQLGVSEVQVELGCSLCKGILVNAVVLECGHAYWCVVWKDSGGTPRLHAAGSIVVCVCVFDMTHVRMFVGCASSPLSQHGMHRSAAPQRCTPRVCCVSSRAHASCNCVGATDAVHLRCRSQWHVHVSILPLCWTGNHRCDGA